MASPRFSRGLLFCFLLTAMQAGTRKGEKLLAQGRVSENRQDYDQALDYYQQAYETDPSDAAYVLGLQRVRFQAGLAHVKAGQKFVRAGEWEKAIAEFRRACTIDPSSQIAEQELRRTLRRSAGSKEEQPALSDAEREQGESERRINSALPVPELKPIQSVLHMTKLVSQPPKVLFETVGKLAGVNVIFDPNYQSTGKIYSAEFSNHTLEQALDYLSVLTKSFWKPLSSNAIFVTQDNPTNRRDYEDQEVKVIYLKNIIKPEEINEIMTVLRTLIEIRHISPYMAQGAILVRGTPDQVLLTEKLIRDMDKPRAEIVVDMMVLETSRGKTREITAALSGSGGYGIGVPVAFTPQNATTIKGSDSSTTGVTLSRAARISSADFSTVLPNAVLNLLATDHESRVRQSPQLRTLDGQKASIKIGQRIPYASGSLNTGSLASNSTPLVSTQFQYADVGVNVDITPRVHSADEVTLHIEMDVSDQGVPVDIGGIKEPVIGQRKIIHDIRVRDGEASILAGLAQDQNSKSQSGIPGLIHIPLLRYLLGSNSNDKQQTDLLIALVPHIIRAPEYTAANMRAIGIGTEANMKLTRAASPEREHAGETAPLQPAGAGIRFGIVPTTVTLGEAFRIAIENASGAPLNELRFQAQFDPKLLRLDEIVAAEPGSVDAPPAITQDIRNELGTATVTLRYSQPKQAGSLSLRFLTRGKGAAGITLRDVQTRNAVGEVIPSAPIRAVVSIQ